MQSLWCNDPSDTAKLCAAQVEMDKRRTLIQAEELCQNIFTFRGHWEMARSSMPVRFQEKVNWIHIPKKDPEWLYALNRHSFLVYLAKAFLYTGEEKYAHKAVQLWEDWIDNVPLTEEARQNTWRSLEAGIRCENWLRSLRLLRDSEALPLRLRKKVDGCLRQHGEYLKEASQDFHRLSNWGVQQDHGLFLAGIHLKDREYTDIAVERLDRELHMQVMRDGSHWEQSPMYHCEVLHCVLDTIGNARMNHIKLPERLLHNAKNMCHALGAWIRPDGRLFCQSDSDAIDARDLLAQGALLFEDGRLKALAGKRLYEENLWDYGREAVSRYEAIGMVEPQELDSALTDSGNYVLRGCRGEKAPYLHMHCGSLGSGHGHADLLHIDMGIYGEDILVDAGRYTYVDMPLRRQMKGPGAHNTTRVDGRDFSECLDSWGYAKLAAPLKGEHSFTEKVSYINGLHMGYMQPATEGPRDSVLTERKVVFLKPDIFVIADLFYTQGTHSYEHYFHFNTGKFTDEGDGSYTYKGIRASARLLVPGGGVQGRITTTPFSTEYNSLMGGDTLILKREGTGFQSLITVFAAGSAGKIPVVSAKCLPVSMVRSGKVLTDEQARAVEIEKDGKIYRVLFAFEELVSEVDFFRAGDSEGYGRVLAFTPQEREGICLAW